MRVLVVEDDPLQASLLKKVLEEAVGYDVETAGSCAAALVELRQRQFDALLLDLELPDSSGLATLERITHPFPDQLIIVFTGRRDEGLALEALKRGAHDYFVKGEIGPVALTRAVRHATERSRLIERARQSERLLDALLGSTSDFIYVKDLEGKYLLVNDSTASLFSLTPAQVIGKNDVELFGSEKARSISAIDHSILRAGRSMTYEDIIVVKGEMRYLMTSKSPLRDERGALVGLVGISRDVTSRREIEEEVRRQSELLAAAELLAESGSWELDLGSNRFSASEGLRSIFGIQHAESVLQDFIQRIHPDDQLSFNEAWEGAMKSSGATRSEVRIILPSGETRIIHNVAFTSHDASGRPMKVTGSALDLTNFRRMEQEQRVLLRQLEQANRLSSIGKLAATVAHEFNNVLMSIQPFVEMLSRRSTDDQTQMLTSRITRSIDRGKRITQEILRYTRDAEPNLKVIDLSRLVAESLPDMQTLLVESGVEIEFRELDDAHKRVRGDAVHLHQIISNLVVNARDASPNGGTIAIQLRRVKSGETFPFGVVHDPDAMLQLSVIDRGVGMPAEVMEHAFEPLFTSNKPGGTGLGLAVVRRFVEAHRGQVFLESQVGRGTQVHLFLPHTSASPEEPEATPSASIDGKLRVLLVEDDPSVAEGVCLLLEYEGFEVHHAAEGREAIPLLERYSADAVVLDLGLPDISGEELYQQIAARWKDLPVIVSSGHGDDSKITPPPGATPVRFLSKPYPVSDLIDLIREMAS